MPPLVKGIDGVALGHEPIHDVAVAAAVLAKAVDDGQGGPGPALRPPALVVEFQASVVFERCLRCAPFCPPAWCWLPSGVSRLRVHLYAAIASPIVPRSCAGGQDPCCLVLCSAPNWSPPRRYGIMGAWRLRTMSIIVGGTTGQIIRSGRHLLGCVVQRGPRRSHCPGGPQRHGQDDAAAHPGAALSHPPAARSTAPRGCASATCPREPPWRATTPCGRR